MNNLQHRQMDRSDIDLDQQAATFLEFRWTMLECLPIARLYLYEGTA